MVDYRLRDEPRQPAVAGRGGQPVVGNARVFLSGGLIKPNGLEPNPHTEAVEASLRTGY
jgi:hypothetical protein